MISAIALRNIWKNRRRSLTSMLTIAVGALAMILFGGFIASIFYGLQTSIIRDIGQIHIYKKDYLSFGAADPDNYLVENYPYVIAQLQKNKALEEEISLITPVVRLNGIASAEHYDHSKTFMAMAVMPEDRDSMLQWNGLKLGTASTEKVSGLVAGDVYGAVIGQGMARMLGLCQPLHLACQDPPQPLKETLKDVEPYEAFDFLVSTEEKQASRSEPKVNLLVANRSGAPNIESIYIHEAKPHSNRVIDDNFILMHLTLAQALLYDGAEHASYLPLQLVHPEKAIDVKQQLNTLFSSENLPLEAVLFDEVDSSFERVISMFVFIFGCVSLFLGLIICFTVANTINMTIMERVKEIGTIRALGFRRAFIMRLFLTESGLISLFGTLLGIIMAIGLALLINRLHVQWTPPSNASAMTIHLMIFQSPWLIVGVSLFLVIISLLAALLPTLKASRMNIVSSLHHH